MPDTLNLNLILCAPDGLDYLSPPPASASVEKPLRSLLSRFLQSCLPLPPGLNLLPRCSPSDRCFTFLSLDQILLLLLAICLSVFISNLIFSRLRAAPRSGLWRSGYNLARSGHFQKCWMDRRMRVRWNPKREACPLCSVHLVGPII